MLREQRRKGMAVRGVRGATTVPSNDAQSIVVATQSLLREMLEANRIELEDLAAAHFTLTDDLDAAFPAYAARQMGWEQVPLFDARQIPVPGSLPRCIRALLMWNTDVPQHSVIHVYQREAKRLRPDLIKK
jgi:chorismate mutase